MFALLDISVNSTVIYHIPHSQILQFYTIKNCNLHCIMQILLDIKHYIQRFTVLLKCI